MKRVDLNTLLSSLGRSWKCSSMVEHLPARCKALDSILSTENIKFKNKKNKRLRRTKASGEQK
jgi:hypothetical protein